MLVTDLFPPMNAVGVHRSVALCRHLVETGWQVTVLAGRDPPAGCGLDEGLVARIPPTVRVVRAASPDVLRIVVHAVKGKRRAVGSAGEPGAKGASPPAGEPSPSGGRRVVDWVSWWLHVPDMRAGWLLPALRAGLREARRCRPSVIFSSAPAWTSHLVGAALSWLLRVPLVADFRDPWCGSAWHKMPYAAHRRVDEWLERAVVRRAAQVTCAWDGIRRHLADRHPARADRIQTVLNGFDAEELADVRPAREDTGRCVLLHAGTLYGPRSPVPLLEGLRILSERWPEQAARLQMVFVGPPTYNGRPLEDLARAHGVAEHVRLVPPTSHRQALSLIKGADVALLFGQSGSETLASVPAKVYEYVGLGKAVLAIGAGPEAVGILRQGGGALWSVPDADAGECAERLREIADSYDGSRGFRAGARSAREQFSRQGMAERLARVLEAVSALGRAPGRASGVRVGQVAG